MLLVHSSRVSKYEFYSSRKDYDASQNQFSLITLYLNRNKTFNQPPDWGSLCELQSWPLTVCVPVAIWHSIAAVLHDDVFKWMETFSALLAICTRNSPDHGEFPAQRPVTRSFDFFFDLRLNKPLSKQWWGWWFETPSRQLWRHCNVLEQNILLLNVAREHMYLWRDFTIHTFGEKHPLLWIQGRFGCHIAVFHNGVPRLDYWAHWKEEDVVSIQSTHWGQVTHIYVRKLNIIGSDNGLSPVRRQAITRTNAGIWLIGPQGTNSSELLIEMQALSFMKIHVKISSAERLSFCRGFNV